MMLTALIPAEKVWLTRIAGSGIAEPTGLYNKGRRSQPAECVSCQDLYSARASYDIALVSRTSGSCDRALQKLATMFSMSCQLQRAHAEEDDFYTARC